MLKLWKNYKRRRKIAAVADMLVDALASNRRRSAPDRCSRRATISITTRSCKCSSGGCNCRR